jgi:hypothetical protein
MPTAKTKIAMTMAGTICATLSTSMGLNHSSTGVRRNRRTAAVRTARMTTQPNIRPNCFRNSWRTWRPSGRFDIVIGSPALEMRCRAVPCTIAALWGDSAIAVFVSQDQWIGLTV